MSDALSNLLTLSENDKQAKGITHTPREIHQQPETWRNTFRDLQAMHAQLEDFLQQAGVGAVCMTPPDVLLVGAGTSDYVGRSLSRLLRQKWQCEVAAVPSTELLTNMRDYLLPKKKYLWISFSRSGDSSEGVAVLEQALLEYPEQVSHLVVTCSRNSTMAQKMIGQKQLLAIVLDDSVNDRGLAMTSSFSNMVVAGQYLACIQSPDMYESLLEDMISMGQTLLPAAADLTFQLAKSGFSKICFLGTGALHSAAEESALKVMELTAGKVQTLTQSFLGLRHGPLSSLNDKSLIVAYISNDPGRARYEMDLLKEIKAKRLGQATLAVSPSDAADLEGVADFVLPLNAPRDFPDACRPQVDAIVGQLLGMFSAMRLGIQPDNPSPGGVITRVVSHVKIYSPEAKFQ